MEFFHDYGAICEVYFEPSLQEALRLLCADETDRYRMVSITAKPQYDCLRGDDGSYEWVSITAQMIHVVKSVGPPMMHGAMMPDAQKKVEISRVMLRYHPNRGVVRDMTGSIDVVGLVFRAVCKAGEQTVERFQRCTEPLFKCEDGRGIEDANGELWYRMQMVQSENGSLKQKKLFAPKHQDEEVCAKCRHNLSCPIAAAVETGGEGICRGAFE